MAVSVSMQSPIPDYANFGSVVSDNINAAAERALKSNINNQQMELANKQFDLGLKEEEYRRNVRAQHSKIAQHKLDIALKEEELDRRYQKAIGEGGEYETGWFGRLFGQDYDKEDWMKAEGLKKPEYTSIYSQLDPQYMDYSQARNLRKTYPFERSTSRSSEEIFNDLMSDELGLMDMVRNPYGGI